MVTMPDSVSKRVNFLVRGPPFDPFFSAIMDEMQISVLPKNSEKNNWMSKQSGPPYITCLALIVKVS